MFELWQGGSFIRIHRAGCKFGGDQRPTDPEAENAMHKEGEYPTLEQAEAIAKQKASRWKKCVMCCDSTPQEPATGVG